MYNGGGAFASKSFMPGIFVYLLNPNTFFGCILRSVKTCPVSDEQLNPLNIDLSLL